jgi:hypothetical protein
MNIKQVASAPARPASSFPVGYHDLHPDVSLNFQLNRFYGWVGDDSMLTEMREAAWPAWPACKTIRPSPRYCSN